MFFICIVWERAYSPVNLKRHFSESHDYIIVFAKNLLSLENLNLTRTDDANARYENPDNDQRGPWKSTDFSVGPRNEENIYVIKTPGGRNVLPPNGRSWVVSEQKYIELNSDNRIWFGSDGNSVPSKKSFLCEVKEGITPMTLWKYSEVGHSQDATKQLKKLFDDKSFFDYPKPVKLIQRMVDLSTRNDDIILDFFAGSGTTAHAVMAQNVADGGNRTYICVQMPEETPVGSEARKAGYERVSEIAVERIKRASAKLRAEHPDFAGDLGVRVYRATDSHFPQWRTKVYESNEELEQAMIDYVNAQPAGTPRERADEVLLKLGYPLTTPLQDMGGWYLAGGALALVLDEKFKAKDLMQVFDAKPTTVIVLEQIFKKDEEKINFDLRCNERKVIFDTI